MSIRPYEGPCREVLLKRLQAAPDNRISFGQWMALALYHPTCGYYMRRQDKIGKGHDFITSSHVHPIFGKFWGKLFAAWAGDKALDLVELGPGEGRLMGALLDDVLQTRPDLYRRLTVYFYETSPYHRQKIKERLKKNHGALSMAFIDDLQDVKSVMRPKNDTYRIVFSNEFWDAHPVERLRVRPEGIWEKQVIELQDETHWEPVWVPYDFFDEAMIEVLHLMGFHQDVRIIFKRLEEVAGLSTEEIETLFQSRDVSMVIEVPLAAYVTYQMVLKQLDADAIVSIDYGMDQVETFLKSLRGGSLRAYYAHTIRDDFWKYPGWTDITSDVPFPLLIRLGEANGYQTSAFQKQGAYLAQQGILDWLRPLQDHDPFTDEARQNRAIVQLIQPGGMGDAFYVLVQKRDV